MSQDKAEKPAPRRLMRLFGIQSPRSTGVERFVDFKYADGGRHWSLQEPGIPADITEPDKIKAWRGPEGQGIRLISTIEGLDPSSRVSDRGENPPRLDYGLIVEYDTPVKLPEDAERILKRDPTEMSPTHLIVTSAGRAALLFQFEEPIPYVNSEQAKAFRRSLLKRLALRSWLPGLRDSSVDYQSYHDSGKQWVPLFEDVRIPSSVLHLWLFEASKNVRLTKDLDYDIPMDVIEEEIERRFPGSWKGMNGVAIGSRCNEFWVPGHDDPTSSQIFKDGVMSYRQSMQDHPFSSWADIFGLSFVEKFTANRYEKLLKGVVFESGTERYWIKENREATEEASEYHEYTRAQLRQRLASPEFGFNPKIRKNSGELQSELDEAMNYLHKHNRVKWVGPFIYRPLGFTEFNDDRYLNTCKTKAFQPVGFPEGMIATELLPEFFPNIWKFLDLLFERIQDANSDHLQRDYFLAWLRHAYKSAYSQNPKSGQALAIVGPPGCGKTKALDTIIAALLGKAADAGPVMVDGLPWTGTLAEAGVNYLDDRALGMTGRQIGEVTNLLKRAVANPASMYNNKFAQIKMIETINRIVILCNETPASIKILPVLDDANEDKFSILRACSQTVESGLFEDKDKEAQQRQFEKELPAFARWLLDTETPDHFKNKSNPRFHIRSFYHPIIHEQIIESSDIMVFFRRLRLFFDRYFADQENETKEHWEGTAEVLRESVEMMLGRGNPAHARAFPESLDRLRTLVRGSGYIQHKRNAYHIQEYRISRNIKLRVVPNPQTVYVSAGLNEYRDRMLAQDGEWRE